MISSIASTPRNIDDSRMGNHRKFAIPIILSLSLLSAFFVYYPITDTDIWWHLAAGRELVRAKAFFLTDPFAYSLDHPQWIDIHWLFQIMAYGIYRATGYWGIIIVKCAITAVVCLILSMVHAGRRSGVFTAALYAPLIFEARFLVLERPVLITLVCMAVFLCCLERFVRTGAWKNLLWLIPAQIFWTNSQGLFAIGFAIILCYAAGSFIDALRISGTRPLLQRIREALPWPLIIAAAALPMISLVNPYGLRGLLFPLRLFERIDPSVSNIFSRTITENIPLFSLNGMDVHYVYATIALTVILLAGIIALGKKLRTVDLLLSAAFFYLSYRAMRNVLLYFVIAAPIIGRTLAILREKIRPANRWKSVRRRAAIAIGGAYLLLLAICVGRTLQVVSCYPHHSPISPFRVPTAAVEFMKNHPVAGRLFNADRFGGYCLWELYPPQQVFVDGRLIIRPAAFFKAYLDLCKYPQRFDELAREHTITQVLLPTAIFLMHMPLVKWLYRSGEWDLVFTDGASVLFTARSSPAAAPPLDLGNPRTVQAIEEAIGDRWKSDLYIRAENLYYFKCMVAFLTTNGD
jgi:hypothetical protein